MSDKPGAYRYTPRSPRHGVYAFVLDGTVACDGAVLKRCKRILVPELNSGQLRLLLRAQFLVDAVGLNKIQGKPFLVSEIEEAVLRLLQS